MYIYAKILNVLSCFSSVRLFMTQWNVALQAPRSMGFSRQEPGVDCDTLLQRIFPNQGLNLCLLYLLHWQAGSLAKSSKISPAKSTLQLVLGHLFFLSQVTLSQSMRFKYNIYGSVQFSSVAQSSLTFSDPMNHSMPGLPVLHQFPEFT